MSLLRTNLRSLSPAAPLARVRLFFLVLAIASAITTVPPILGADQPLAARIAATLMAVGLAAYWVAGYRRDGFSFAVEPLEAAALFVLLRVCPGEPFLPLFGLVYRSLYGRLPVTLARYALWAGALFLGHAPRGAEHMHGDIARAVGLGLAPGILHALRAALDSVQASERRLRSLVQNSTDVITVVGDDLRVRWQAESIRRVLGHDPGEVLGSPLLELVHPDDRASLERFFAEARERPDLLRTLPLRMRAGDGQHRHFEVAASNRLHDPAVEGFVLNLRDASEHRRLEGELRTLAAEREHDALHDALTGLANRRKLFTTLRAALTEATDDDTQLALLLIDLDRFKELNDTLGHHAGDHLLREIGPRLLAAAPSGALVARLGGDEFAVLLPAGADADAASLVATRLRMAIEQPFHFQGLTLLVQASLGIAIFPEHGREVETLMQRADIAMYAAKSGGLGHAVYDASEDGHSRERLTLVGEIPDALRTDQVLVYYQPKFELRSGRIVGAEALVRWEHPRLGLLSPAAFLPLVEQTGLMRPLTLHVLDRALEQATRWRDAGLPLGVAVNLGAPNLLDLVLPSDIVALLEKWNADPAQLQLEITETLIGADPVRVGEVMRRLREVGISLSLDDFGTGSSSLAYLRRLPVQELKIDKSFILGMATEPRDAAIVRTTIGLAHDLGLRAVAEGIETEIVREQLVAYGCDQGQGYLLGRPMPAEELTVLMAAAPMTVR